METREIKFRSWDGKKYHYHNHLSGLYGVLVVESHQFTGLKDKNGVEIYEGDILKRRGQPNTFVVFEKAAWCMIDDQPEVRWSQPLGQTYLGWIEVIGNIYEHPHLLNL